MAGKKCPKCNQLTERPLSPQQSWGEQSEQ